MDFKERAQKDLDKLQELIDYFKSLELDKKYPEHFSHALNYKKDSEHYFSKEDYFSSFGCSNYAFGILESLLYKEKKKFMHEL